MKCKCENTDVVACVKIKIKGELMNRRGFDGSIDKLVDIEPGDIVQIIGKKVIEG
jgi:hypothetical protein